MSNQYKYELSWDAFIPYSPGFLILQDNVGYEKAKAICECEGFPFREYDKINDVIPSYFTLTSPFKAVSETYMMDRSDDLLHDIESLAKNYPSNSFRLHVKCETSDEYVLIFKGDNVKFEIVKQYALDYQYLNLRYNVGKV